MGEVSIGLLAATQGLAAFSTFMPQLSAIREASPNGRMRGNVHTGELAGLTVTLSLGLMASTLSKSSIPFICSLIISAVTIAVYENALQQYPTEES